MKLSHSHVLFFIGLVFCLEFFSHSQRLGNDLLSHRNNNNELSSFHSEDSPQPPPPDDPFPSLTAKKSPPKKPETHSEVSDGGILDDSSLESHSDGALMFSPSVLKYESSPVCIPQVSTFTITNTLDVNVQLTSISADNPQFYPVLFQPQPLAAKKSIQIRILFLPFYAQASGATLSVSTSLGIFEYAIEGAPAYNAYRLHPFVGYRIPSGVPFEQPITIHNPHNEVLRIREIYTTEEFLSLRGAMSSDQLNATGSPVSKTGNYMGSDVWELEPGTERTVIHLSMASSVPGSYLGYVHLKTDRDNIVIPVDVQVLEGGLYSTPEAIDFGVLMNPGDVSEVQLLLMNSGSKIVEVTDIVPVEPDLDLAISFSSEDRVLLNGSSTKIATLVYTSPSISKKISNKLLILTNHSNPALATLEIPYTASIIHGGFGHNARDFQFVLPVQNASAAANGIEYNNIQRSVALSSYFTVPLKVQDVLMAECSGFFFSA